MERYFIRNCLGQIVGNPKGYATYKGANMIFNRQKMQVELLDLAHELGVKVSPQNSVLIGSIKLEKGAVLCTYSVRVDSVIVGRTQVTFDHEKAVCLEREPLASILEQD